MGTQAGLCGDRLAEHQGEGRLGQAVARERHARSSPLHPVGSILGPALLDSKWTEP